MLSNEQLERYSRHIILKEVGAKGQKKLLNAKVLIIGAGGLGTLIFTGLGLMQNDFLWIGGLSVAILSLGVGFILSLIDKWITRYERVK